MRNPGFARMLAIVYALLAATSLAALSSGPESLVDTAQAGDLLDYLGAALGGASIVVGFLLVLALVLYADAGWFGFKFVAGVLHAAVHLAVILVPLWFLLERFEPDASSVAAFAAGAALAALLGLVIGPVVFAVSLVTISLLRGRDAWQHANEIFAGQAIEGYKNFLRLHVGRDGTLTIHPLKVQRVCSKWDVYRRPHEDARPAFEPRPGNEPRVERIEPPIPLR